MAFGDIQISTERTAAVTVEDHENGNIRLNTLSQTTADVGGLVANEVPLRPPGTTFFGDANGRHPPATAPCATTRAGAGAMSCAITSTSRWRRTAPWC